MKKCPACGVVMGDNVARCSMCKYDFQKAAREGEDAAIKEATLDVFQIERMANDRAAERKAESERIIAEAKKKGELEIEALSRSLEGEKLRLEQEYVEIRKKALEERSSLDSELASVRQRVEEENKFIAQATVEREKIIDGARAAAQLEAERIMIAVQEETKALAVQVQEEYNAAVAEKQKIIDEAEAAQRRLDQAHADYDIIIESAEEIKRQAQRDAEEVRKLAEQEGDVIRQQAHADAAAALGDVERSRQALIDEAEQIKLQNQNTKVMAEEELAGYINEAKAAIAAADEALLTKTRVEEEIRAALERTESSKLQAEDAKRKADQETEAILREAEAIKRTAQEEEQACLQRTEEARNQALLAAKAYSDELEAIRKQVQDETEASMEQRRIVWATAEQEAVMLNQELADARESAKEALEARRTAEEQMEEARRVAAEDAGKIILDAEKRAAAIRDIAMSQSEKGRISKEFEEKIQSNQAEITRMEQVLSAREEDLVLKEKKVGELMEEIRRIHENQQLTGFVPVSVPMDYEVEIIPHKRSGEVDTDEIARVLARRGTDGWKLHSVLSDELGRVQSAIGVEKVSLSADTGIKEDRVILIFERVSSSNNKDTSPSIPPSNNEDPSSPK